MSKKMSNEDFVASARAAHGSRFKYEKCVYDGKKNKLIIICRMHGAFLTHPDTHLKGKHGGCDKCARIQHGRRSSERCRSKVRDLDISDIVKYEPETGDFIWVKNTTIRESIGRLVAKPRMVILNVRFRVRGTYYIDWRGLCTMEHGQQVR
jgi:hypothetical protein